MGKISNGQQQRYLIIQHGKTRQIIAAWRYYSIVDILRELGVNHLDAHETAKWAGRSPAGVKKTIGEIKMEVVEQ